MKFTNIFATARQILENDKEELFTNFQKNNRPSGFGYIQKHCEEYMFEAIKDDVLAASETSKLIIKSVSAEVIDYDDSNGTKVASVRYTAVIVVDGEAEDIDEAWHFKYDGWSWLLAGIEQV